MNNSFVAYKSFIDAIRTLPEEEQLKCHNMIYDYALCGIEPTEEDGIVYTLFLAFRPQIDANSQRRTNGAKGGRPKNEEPKEEKPSVIEEETIGFEDENHRLETPKPNVNVNVNVNDNVNVDKKKSKKEKDFSFESVCDGELLNSLKEFEKMRKSIKKPLTPRARSMLWNKLNKMSSDPNIQIAIVNQSIFHNWQDVYELRADSKEVPNYNDVQTDNGLAISDEEYLKFLSERKNE